MHGRVDLRAPSEIRGEELEIRPTEIRNWSLSAKIGWTHLPAPLSTELTARSREP